MRLLERHPTLRVPRLLLGLGLASAFAWLAQSYESNPDNFSVFLFDYQFEFMRRGLLGEATRRLAGGIEPYRVYRAVYWIALAATFLLAVRLLWVALGIATGRETLERALFAAAILASPLFLKNAFHDFGRADQLGLLAVLGFALAPTASKRVLLVLVPPLLLLCHEALVFQAVVPMFGIFAIDALRREDVTSWRTVAPLALGGAIALGLSLYFLEYGIPTVPHEVLSRYQESKSPYNVGERSWLLYDDVQANVDQAMGRRGFGGRQLAASPIYVLALVLHWPIVGVLVPLARQADARLRLACGAIVLVVAVQCVLFAISIDYARWLSNIFATTTAMLLFVVWQWRQDVLVVTHVRRRLFLFVAVLLVLLPVPRFGVITP
jgi:hypothetical protein